MKLLSNYKNKSRDIFLGYKNIIILVLCCCLSATIMYITLNKEIYQCFGYSFGDDRAYYAVLGWNNTLQKLDYDADVVFFGDSFIYYSDFREFFPDKKIVTLGFAGDTLKGMQERVEGVAALKPEKIFVMAGVNGLKSYTLQSHIEDCDILCSMIAEQIPGANVYCFSVLPVCNYSEKNGLNNDTIVDYNRNFKEISEKYGFTYIDLYSFYLDDNGAMDQRFSADGVHILPEYYAIWAEQINQYIYER